MPWSRRLVLPAAAALLLAPLPARAWFWRGGLPDPAEPSTTLDGVEAAITRLIPVPEITAEALAPRLSDFLLFDVREPAEYAQSRLPGAIRLDPAMPAAEFRAAHGARVAGADVVFYCAVGWRSGRMLELVRGTIAGARPRALFNLRGGLFRWRVLGLPLEGGAEVHPFDRQWGRLLERSLGG